MGARFSAPIQTSPGAHPASCTIGTGSFSGVKSGRGVTLTPHPLLVLWSRKSRAIPLLLLLVVQPVQSLSACTVQLYLYSPLARTACTEPQCLYSTAIPLLPLYAVQPVQYSYTSTPPISRTACTEPQCLYSTAIPVLPLWTVQPVQSLCTEPQSLFKGALYYPKC